MTEEFNRKIKKAIEKLSTLEQVKLVDCFTSDYSYGMSPPCLKDRYNLDIKIDLDLTLKTQISFDSKYLSFPPDIVIRNLPAEQSQDLIALLPQRDWNLDQESCLYTWFKGIINLFKKPEPKKQWALFEDASKRDRISQNSSSAKTGLEEYLYKTNSDDDFEDASKQGRISQNSSNTNTGFEESLYKTNMDDDFEDDPSLYLENEPEGMDIEEEEEDIIVYKKYRNKLKPKDNLIDDTSNFFADQDDILSYKTRAETFEDTLFSKKTSPASGSSSIFNRSKRSYVDHINTNAKNDDSDDDIVLPPVKTKKPNQPNQPRSTSLLSSKSMRKKNKTGLRTPTTFSFGIKSGGNIEYRKKFMSEWLLTYKSNIMKYDAENYSNFTLLLQFRLSKSDLSSSFKKLKEESLKKYIEEHPDGDKINKAKQVAPIIINFNMNKNSFPSTPLEIKLISVMNTTSTGSSEPDSMDLKYSVIQNESLSKTVNDIMNLITDAVPAFHYQLNDQ